MQQDDAERYALVCFGDDGVRTIFCAERIAVQIPVTKTTVEGRNPFWKLMQRDLKNESGSIEIPNGRRVIFTTVEFHKGRQAISAGA